MAELRLRIHYTTLSFTPTGVSALQVSTVPHKPRQLVSSHTSLVPVSEHPSLSGQQALTQTTASLLVTQLLPKKEAARGIWEMRARRL